MCLTYISFVVVSLFSNKRSLESYVPCGSDMVKWKRYKYVVNVRHCWSSWKPSELPGMPTDVKYSSCYTGALYIKHGTAFCDGNITYAI